MRKLAQNEVSTVLRISGMDCAEEVAAIERALKPLPGVQEVRVNLLMTVAVGGPWSSANGRKGRR